MNGNALVLNASSLNLLTNGGRESIRYVALVRLKDGRAALRPMETPEGTMSVAQLSDRRHISASPLAAKHRQVFTAEWNDVEEQLELTAVEAVIQANPTAT